LGNRGKRNPFFYLFERGFNQPGSDDVLKGRINLSRARWKGKKTHGDGHAGGEG